MYLNKLIIKNYGPITNLEYDIRLNNEGNPVPLVLIGKNGSGKTLLITSIVDMFVEAKRKLYPNGILEVNSNNYYKKGNRSYIKHNEDMSYIKVDYGHNNRHIIYTDVMARNPKQDFSGDKRIEEEIKNNSVFKKNGYYREVDLNGIEVSEFESSIRIFFPFDRYYKPLWYNLNNYNRISYDYENSVGYSTTNIIKTDILSNVQEWTRSVFLQSLMQQIQIPKDDKISKDLWEKKVNIKIDTKLQSYLKRIISIIKEDGNYDVIFPSRNNKLIGLTGPNIHCSDISQMSAGELCLYAIAVSIIKEWDLFYNDNNIDLNDITGCVLIDEADANLHIDFAFRALPKLMKLFPKVQFILSAHSPFFLAGLKKEYENDIDFLSLPDGVLINDLNSFSEITEAYDVFSLEIDELKKQVELLENENKRISSLENKVIIYTEGKTDVQFLKLALQKLSEYEDIKSKIEFYDMKDEGLVGASELDKLFTAFQKSSDSNIKICIFDKDDSRYIFKEDYVKGNNNVYKFNIKTPPFRNESDLISIEHCFTDEEIKTFDENGRRFFMAGEFDDIKGTTEDNNYLFQFRSKRNPLQILDGSGANKVYKNVPGDKNNYALSKNNFIEHIKNNDKGFDKFSFEGFRPTLETIKRIIKEAEQTNV